MTLANFPHCFPQERQGKKIGGQIIHLFAKIRGQIIPVFEAFHGQFIHVLALDTLFNI
nr:MAG TPA: hypothetical protein [Caudoviricetes sp.]